VDLENFFSLPGAFVFQPGDQVMFNNLRDDWNTYERDIWRQGLWVMAVYRFGRWRYGFKHRIVRMPFSLTYKLLFTFIQIITGIEIPCEVKLGKRVRIDHFGGIIVSGDATLGDHVILRNGVTIGLRRTGVRGSPKIGNRVDIGAGAKILGSITVGDDTVIGANAVVLHDVPNNSIAVGIPAKVVPRRPPNERYTPGLSTESNGDIKALSADLS
jgi:serine O-acetyltransferase